MGKTVQRENYDQLETKKNKADQKRNKNRKGKREAERFSHKYAGGKRIDWDAIYDDSYDLYD